MTDGALNLRDKRVKPRYNIQVHAHIKAQLIGSATKFPFVTENLSESGLLVTHEANFRHSFNTHSILEVWVKKPDGDEIFFFAKYVRKASDTSFAIRVIDIDPANSKKYQDFIDEQRELLHPDDEEEEG